MTQNPLRIMERNAVALGHVMACKVQGELWMYVARTIAIPVWVMPEVGVQTIATRLGSRNDLATSEIEVAMQSTNKGAYIDTAGSWVGGVATLTIGANTVVVGDTVVVSGVNPSGFNGTFSVTAVGATTISYALAANPGAWVSAGVENTATAFPPAFGLSLDDTVIDVFGNVNTLTKIDPDDLFAVYNLTFEQTTPRRSGQVA